MMTRPGRQLDKDIEHGQQKPASAGFFLSIRKLGAALPRTGGIILYPVYSHGPLMGYLMGSITVIAFTSLLARCRTSVCLCLVSKSYPSARQFNTD
jgi:hypothetical protein